MTRPENNLLQRAAAIRLVVMDVDGVLTDGTIAYTSDNEELKGFNVKDGLGISLGVREGYQFAIITARESAMVVRRAGDLGIQHVIQKTKTKLPALERLLTELGLRHAQMAYIGDDLPDMPCMAVAGLSACPADAAIDVRALADLVSSHGGGNGAVRELMEFLIECRQLFSEEAQG